MEPKGTVCLVSGGADSATLLCRMANTIALEPIYPLTFMYGSQHMEAETESAIDVVRHYQEVFGPEVVKDHTITRLPPEMFTGSALTDEPEALPSNRTIEEMVSEVAPSYVPARNSILLALAAGRADAWGAKYIAYAAHHEDSPGYPDCRPEFFKAMNRALMLGTENKVDLLAPFITWSKTDILVYGAGMKVPYHLTHSCYRGTKPACGECDTCILRIESFKKAGLKDPIEYAITINWGV